MHRHDASASRRRRASPVCAHTWRSGYGQEVWLTVEGFHSGGQWIAARTPIKLRAVPYPRYNALFVDNCEPFWLGANGATEDKLREAAEEEFDVLWRNYAFADDTKLTSAAQKLKAELLAAFVVEGR
jgi:hypothetical protein